MTPQFGFHHMEVGDLDKGIRIHMCGRSSCVYSGKNAYTFHTGCYSIAPDSFSPSFAPAIAYDYRPSYGDECLRARRIRDAAAANVRLSILKYLPREIVDMVMENLVMEVAALCSQEIFSSLSFTKEFKYSLNLRQDFYVKYRKIEGVNYVQWLSNTNMSGKGLRLYEARRDKQVEALWVAFDHLGVRRIDLRKHPAENSIGVGSLPYWKEIIPGEGMTLVCIHDVRPSPLPVFSSLR